MFRSISSIFRISGPKFFTLSPNDQSHLLRMTDYVGQTVSRAIQTKPSLILSETMKKLIATKTHKPNKFELMIYRKIAEARLNSQYLSDDLNKVRSHTESMFNFWNRDAQIKAFHSYLGKMLRYSCGNCSEIAVLTHFILHFYLSYYICQDPLASNGLRMLRPLICSLQEPNDHCFNLLVREPQFEEQVYSTDDVCLVLDNWHPKQLQLSVKDFQKNLQKSVDYNYIFPQKSYELVMQASLFSPYNNPQIIKEAIKYLQEVGILPHPERKDLLLVV